MEAEAFGVTPAEDFSDLPRQNLVAGGYNFNAEDFSGADKDASSPETYSPAEDTLFDESVVQDEQDGGVDFMNADDVSIDPLAESPTSEDPATAGASDLGGPDDSLGSVPVETQSQEAGMIASHEIEAPLGRGVTFNLGAESSKEKRRAQWARRMRGSMKRNAEGISEDKVCEHCGRPYSVCLDACDEMWLPCTQEKCVCQSENCPFNDIWDAESPLDESPVDEDPLTADPSDLGGPEDFSADATIDLEDGEITIHEKGAKSGSKKKLLLGVILVAGLAAAYQNSDAVLEFFEGLKGDEADPILGCMDETANNYDATATEDDGTCTYDPDDEATA